MAKVGWAGGMKSAGGLRLERDEGVRHNTPQDMGRRSAERKARHATARGDGGGPTTKTRRPFWSRFWPLSPLGMGLQGNRRQPAPERGQRRPTCASDHWRQRAKHLRNRGCAEVSSTVGACGASISRISSCSRI